MKMKIIASALFALLVATMMISNVKAVDPTPQSPLVELKAIIQDANNELFRGFPITNTKQLKDALVRKIDVVIKIINKGDREAAINKLGNDISPKLTICNTTRVRALSWLSYIHDYEVVSAFADECQNLISRAIILLT